MGSCSFSCEHQPECPLKMGEDSKQCVVGMDILQDRMASRLTCVWWRDRYQPIDSSRLDDHHDCSQNLKVVARPLGYEMGVCLSM